MVRTRRKPAKRSARRRESPKLRAALTPHVKERDTGLMVLAVVAIVAAVALLMIVDAGTTGEVTKKIPENMCDNYCPEESYGVPTGAHSRIHYCRCYTE